MNIRFSLRVLLLMVVMGAIASWWFLTPNDATRTLLLRAWIAEHEADIFESYSCAFHNEMLTRESFFQYWIDDYVDVGYEFEAVARDGMGGYWAVWHRPKQKGNPPLVFFGGDGEHDVVCRSAWDFPLVIANCPQYWPENGVSVEQYKKTLTDSWEFEAVDSHQRYREAVLKQYGTIPPLEELVEGTDYLQTEFDRWLERCREGE